MLVLGPKRGPVAECRRVDEAVGERERIAGGVQRERRVEGDHLAALHHGGDLEGVVFTAVPKDFLEDLIDRDDGHEEVFGVFNRRGEEGGALAVGEVFQKRSFKKRAK